QTLSSSSSGRLFGPYCCRRAWASLSDKPLTGSTFRDATTSAAGWAHHVTSLVALMADAGMVSLTVDLAFDSTFIIPIPAPLTAPSIYKVWCVNCLGIVA